MEVDEYLASTSQSTETSIDSAQFIDEPMDSDVALETSTETAKTDEQPIDVNSLLILNDYCLLKILEVSSLESLCRLADVCKRFKLLAEDVFSRRFPVMLCGARYYRVLFRRMLVKFGHLIKKLQLEVEIYLTQSDVNAIATYCPDLECFAAFEKIITCAMFKPVFARLKCLEIVKCQFIGDTKAMFDDCAQLTTLYIHANEVNDIPQRKFPKLKVLLFVADSDQKTSALCQLLQKNPQIKVLRIPSIANDELISNVVQYAKKVEELDFWVDGRKIAVFNPPTRRGVLKLANLKSLKQLHLLLHGETSGFATALAEKLAVKNRDIQRLLIFSKSIESRDLPSFLKLKSLHELDLMFTGELTDTDLTLITKELRSLERLSLHFTSSAKYSVSSAGLVNAIRFGEQLLNLNLDGVRNMIIDQGVFESLVDVVKKRNHGKLVIRFSCCKTTTTFDVPTEIQQANGSILQISYKSLYCLDQERCEMCKEEKKSKR